ncbi:kinetochore Sim4 complex subunit FTA2-domain-containing protein [Cladorrhinum sp. PSN259]|nr:kinetochore Sim4 complex subunit FTA2-domain-containing protein [Cladorrhinum sp. PSN259]
MSEAKRHDVRATDTSAPVVAAPLPRVPGPKLGPFTPAASADIKFLEVLGDDDSKDSHVWKAQIKVENDWKIFALKMFKPDTMEYPDISVEQFDCDLTEQDFTEGYLSAFGCECRAYGRLQEHNREDLAHRAHGYLLISYQQQLDLLAAYSAQVGYTLPPDHLDGLWGRPEEDRHLPIKAIVKELMTETSICIRPSQLRRACEDLEALHKLGIFVLDIYYWNYLDSKLIDFSRALTSYHPLLDSDGDHGDEDDSEARTKPRYETETDKEAFLVVAETATNGDAELDKEWDVLRVELCERLDKASREYEYEEEHGLTRREGWEYMAVFQVEPDNDDDNLNEGEEQSDDEGEEELEDMEEEEEEKDWNVGYDYEDAAASWREDMQLGTGAAEFACPDRDTFLTICAWERRLQSILAQKEEVARKKNNTSVSEKGQGTVRVLLSHHDEEHPTSRRQLSGSREAADKSRRCDCAMQERQERGTVTVRQAFLDIAHRMYNIDVIAAHFGSSHLQIRRSGRIWKESRPGNAVAL